MFREKIEKILLKIAYEAVCYAETLIGSGKGKEKKQKAIEYVLSKLPLPLKVIKPLLSKWLDALIDAIIEKAVDMLHSVQESQKKRLEGE